MRSLWLLAGVTAGVLVPPQADPLLPWVAALAIGLAALARVASGGLLLVGGAVLAHWLVVAAVESQLNCEERVLAQARVTDVPARSAGGWRFEAEVRHPRQPDRAPVTAMIDMPGPQRPAAGETWQLLLRYDAIPRNAEGAVDPMRLAVRDGRQARARVLRSPLNQRLEAAGWSIDAMRERVARRIQQRASDPSAGALLAALTVGATGEVSTRQWRDFSATGITHLVAISGAHVTFFALLSMALVRRAWSRLRWLQHRVQRERLAGAAGILLATGYALLSGFSVPAQRTLLMLCAFVLWRESARATTPCWSLAVAMCAVLALNPLAVLGAGFWLSFAAVAAILLLPGSRLGEQDSLRSAARVQFAVSLALLPMTVLLFGSFSFSGLLVNAAAIPLFGFVLVPGALLATLAYLLPGSLPRAAGDLLVDCSAVIAAWMLPWLGRVAQWEGSNWLGQMALLPLALAALSTLACLLPLRPAVRVAALLLAFSGFLGTWRPPPAGTALLDIVGTGTRTSIVATTASQRIVFGTGEVHGGDGRRFRSAVVERLRRQGGPRPSLLVVGSPRAERLSAATVAAAAWQGIAIAADGSTRPLPPELLPCGGHAWQSDGVHFGMLAPLQGRGCALLVRTTGGSALLTLDVDAAGWKSLLETTSRTDFIVLPAAATQVPVGADEAATWLLGERLSSGAGDRRWRQLRDAAREHGYRLLDASTLRALRVVIGADGPVRVAEHGQWRWGAWSGREPAGCL